MKGDFPAVRGILRQEEKLHVGWSSVYQLIMQILIYNHPLKIFHLEIHRKRESQDTNAQNANFQSVKTDSSF